MEIRPVNIGFGDIVFAVIVTDSGHIVLSALQPETLANRVGGEKEDAE